MCAEILREDDIVCRHGGEEFALLLSHATLTEAAISANRLRKRASGLDVDLQGRKIHFTISIGVTPCRVGVETINDALTRADTALYEAKARGRNRIVSAAPSRVGG